MSAQYDNGKWGVDDFKRYHAGAMSQAERHALEKATLDDPFLEAALEGYAFSANPEAELAELRQRLEEKKSSKNARVIWYKRRNISNLLKVAAALILFAGVAWLLYPKEEQGSTKMASSKPATVTNIDTATSIPSEAHPGDISEVQANSGKVERRDTFLSAVAKRPTKTLPGTIIDEVQRKDATQDNSLLADASTAAADQNKKEREQVFSRKMQASVPVIANVISGTVVDIEGKPVPYAVLSVPSLNSNLTADTNGNFVLSNSSNLQLVEADVNAAGFEKANALLNAASNNNKIVLEPASNALNEIVVIGYGTAKKSSVDTRAKASPNVIAAGTGDVRIMFKNAKPLQSWEEFNDAINQQRASRFIDSSGVVVLRFDVDSRGASKNIEVIKKLSPAADVAAKQILQNAPAIKKIKKDRKAEATIRF